MVKTCCVYNCRNRATAESKANNISFFRFPANKRKLQAWVKAVNREDWEPNTYTAICSEHFVYGWHSDDPRDANYAPTLFIDHEKRRKWKRKHYQGTRKPEENMEQEDSPVSRDHGYLGRAILNENNFDEPNLTENQLSRVVTVSNDIPDHLKDHQYCKSLPWPGKRQNKTSHGTPAKSETGEPTCNTHESKSHTEPTASNSCISEQLAAESLLLLFQSEPVIKTEPVDKYKYS